MSDHSFIFVPIMRNRDGVKEHSINERAIEMIAKEGLDGFGINKLARAAKVAPGTIYLYYKSKEDLILNLSVDVSSRMLESSLEGLRSDMSFSEGLKIQWVNRYNYFKKNPTEVQFAGHVRYSPVYDKVERILTDKYGDILGPFINNAVKRKELADLPFEMYWSLAFAPLYQLIRFHEQDRGKKFTITPKVLDETLKIVVKGLKP